MIPLPEWLLQVERLGKVHGPGGASAVPGTGPAHATSVSPLTGAIVAAWDVSFEVAPGEALGVIGESGSGEHAEAPPEVPARHREGGPVGYVRNPRWAPCPVGTAAARSHPPYVAATGCVHPRSVGSRTWGQGRSREHFLRLRPLLHEVPRTSDPVVQDRPLDLFDGVGDLDAARAGVGAADRSPTAPHARLIVEDVEPLGRALVA